VGQIILDEQIFDTEVLIPLTQWITAQRLRDLRPDQVIKDERVPVILRELRQPTFVTIDMGFWNGRLRDARYCILCFPLRSDEQRAIPGLLRHLLRMSEFATKAARMGKVARVSQSHIDYWQLGNEHPHRLSWPPATERKGGVIREQGPAYEYEAPEVSTAEDQSLADLPLRTLIQVQGPPVSQTIIEERR
jgi:hypothetical protein